MSRDMVGMSHEMTDPVDQKRAGMSQERGGMDLGSERAGMDPGESWCAPGEG